MWLLPRRAFLRNAPFSVSLGALDVAFSVLVEVSEAAAQWAGVRGLFNGLSDSGLSDFRACFENDAHSLFHKFRNALGMKPVPSKRSPIDSPSSPRLRAMEKTAFLSHFSAIRH